MTRRNEICCSCQVTFTPARGASADFCPKCDAVPCALCPSPADPNGFYPDLCPTCTEVEYGQELSPED